MYWFYYSLQFLQHAGTSSPASSTHCLRRNKAHNTKRRKKKPYLPVVADMVMPLILLGRAATDVSSFPTLIRLKYAGCLGSTRTMVLLLSMATTSNIVGRSAAFSCTHSSAMFMHLIISAESGLGTNDVSMSSIHLPSWYNCHACLQLVSS